MSTHLPAQSHGIQNQKYLCTVQAVPREVRGDWL